MTFKSLMNFAGFHKEAPPVFPAMDRYHGGHEHGHGHGHGWHGSKKGGGGGSGAALSALTLLAFLFLMNVMQQSLMENNATETTTTQTTIFLRQDQQPISLPSGVIDRSVEKDSSSESSIKQNNKKEISYVKL